MFRFANVRGARTRSEVAAYLPNNYSVMTGVHDWQGVLLVLIAGEDEAGWTLDGYVFPRLASGGMIGEEVKVTSDYRPCGGRDCAS